MPSSHQENPNPCTPPQLISKSHRSRPRTKFAHGSDLVLKSVDGEEFPAHSLILSLASPVFADMFESDSSCLGKTIELTETGEMTKLTLKFIYPGQFPTFSSFDVLEKALHIANKYQLDHMYQYLRQKLSEPDSTVSAYANSLSAFNVAMNHGLKDEIRLAASLAHDKHNFTTVDGLLELAKSAPAAIT